MTTDATPLTSYLRDEFLPGRKAESLANGRSLSSYKTTAYSLTRYLIDVPPEHRHTSRARLRLAVMGCVTPVLISEYFTAMAQDGISLHVRHRLSRTVGVAQVGPRSSHVQASRAF